MLTRKSKPTGTDLFQIPFSGAVQWDEYIEIYPDIIKEMDGKCSENCLLFYYEKNFVNQVYNFRDEDAEFDIANILGIDINITVEGESIEDKNSRKIHSCNDIIELSEKYDKKLIKNKTCNDLNNLDDLDIFDDSVSLDLTDYKKIKENNKLAKKERRRLRVLERTSEALTEDNNIEI